MSRISKKTEVLVSKIGKISQITLGLPVCGGSEWGKPGPKWVKPAATREKTIKIGKISQITLGLAVADGTELSKPGSRYYR